MITTVSGLPRSGTSLIMQMLKQGGMELLTDNVRKADESNPNGYFEYEKVKALQRDSAWMREAEGKVVKVIAQLLKFLPACFDYKVIFIERDIQEILRSQKKMLEEMGQSISSNQDIIKKVFEKQVEETMRWLSSQNNISVLYLKHREVLYHPYATAEEINSFLNQSFKIDLMVQIVDMSLYRQRADELFSKN